MECPKCKGLMMLERFSDFFLIFYAWKCINCGAIIDRTISNNRQKSLAARKSQAVVTPRTIARNHHHTSYWPTLSITTDGRCPILRKPVILLVRHSLGCHYSPRF